MPRIIFARALPVGVESLRENVLIELEYRLTPGEVKRRLNSVLPRGIEIIEAKDVSLFSSSPTAPLQTFYWVFLDHVLSKVEVASLIKRALDKKELYLDQERKGKKRRIDIRPLIETIEIMEPKGHPLIDETNRLEQEFTDFSEISGWGVKLVVRNEEGKTAKPSEILEMVLGLQGDSLAQCRIIKVN